MSQYGETSFVMNDLGIVIEKKIEIITKQLLEELGENPEREGLLKTPTRVAKAWEFFSLGYNQKLDDIINQAIFKEDAKDMVIVRDIEFFSLCEHGPTPCFKPSWSATSLAT